MVQTPWIPLTPHIGAGIGYAHVWDRSVSANGNNVSGDTSRLAYQAIGGLDYSLTPNQKIGVDYRYMVIHDASFPTVAGGSEHAGDLNNHTILATYRYEFNAPPAPPPPEPVAAAAAPPPAPPAPPAVHPYEVYFEFDTLDLDPGRAPGGATSGTKRDPGQRHQHRRHRPHRYRRHRQLQPRSLQEARGAATVKAELVKDGVPANEIATNGVGEQDLAVPTADQVNEPRNRRVEITVQAPGM